MQKLFMCWPQRASQRPGVTRATLEIKKSDADSDFPHFSPRVDVDRGDFGVEED